MRYYLLITYAIFSLLLVPCLALTGQSALAGTTKVVTSCPIYLSSQFSPLYLHASNIALNYTIFTGSTCYAPNLKGVLAVYHANNGSVAYTTNNVPLYLVDNTPASLSIPVTTATPLPEGSYEATLNISLNKSSTLTTSEFNVFNPADVILKNFSITQEPLFQRTQAVFVLGILNNGSLASGPIVLYLNVSGPRNYNITESIDPLASGQSEQIALVLKNITDVAGSYSASVSAVQAFNTTRTSSNTASLTYNVTVPQQQQASNSSYVFNTVVPLEYSAISQFPFYLQLAPGVLSGYNIGFENTQSQTETFSIVAPSAFKDVISLSAKNVSLPAGQIIEIQSLLNVKSTMLPGTYYVPLDVSVGLNSGRVYSAVQPLNFQVLYPTNSIDSRTQILASTTNTLLNRASVSITAYSPLNETLNNVTLITTLPRNTISNLSQLGTSAQGGNATMAGNTASISWFIPTIFAGQISTVYYFISNPNNIITLPYAQELLIIPSFPNISSMIKTVKISNLTLLTNLIGQENISFFYTGSQPQNITVSLIPKSYVSVTRPQKVYAMPNQRIERTFNISSEVTGTFVLTAEIATSNASISYKTSAIFLPPATTTTINQTTSIPIDVVSPAEKFVAQYGDEILKILIYFVAFAIVVVLLVELSLLYLKHTKKVRDERLLGKVESALETDERSRQKERIYARPRRKKVSKKNSEPKHKINNKRRRKR